VAPGVGDDNRRGRLMAENSGIEWTDATWNVIAGCTPISAGCQNCYAAMMARRLEAMGQDKYRGTAERRGKVDVFTGVVNYDESALDKPLHWRKPRRIFVNSMSDLFHEGVSDEQIVQHFAVMLLTQRHTYQVLTKRPERMRRIVAAPNFGECVYDMAFTLSHQWCCGGLIDAVPETDILPNVWLGVSVEDQQRKARIGQLRHTPAAVRFLSLEPLLEDLGELDLTGIHWVIVGGESGSGARPCDIAWIRPIVRQCRAAGVSCFVKQLGTNIIDRNDAGFDAASEVWAEGPQAGQPVDPRAWPEPLDIEENLDGTIDGYQGAPVRVRLRDRKGGTMEEWPNDLRVRQFPEVANV
jgi:protein gp37